MNGNGNGNGSRIDYEALREQIKPRLRRAPLNLALDQLAGEDGVRILGKLIREWERSNPHLGLKDLARMALLTPITVRRLAWGETRTPRLLTCIMVFKALGFRAVRLD